MIDDTYCLFVDNCFAYLRAVVGVHFFKLFDVTRIVTWSLLKMLKWVVFLMYTSVLCRPNFCSQCSSLHIRMALNNDGRQETRLVHNLINILLLNE